MGTASRSRLQPQNQPSRLPRDHPDDCPRAAAGAVSPAFGWLGSNVVFLGIMAKGPVGHMEQVGSVRADALRHPQRSHNVLLFDL